MSYRALKFRFALHVQTVTLPKNTLIKLFEKRMNHHEEREEHEGKEFEALSRQVIPRNRGASFSWSGATGIVLSALLEQRTGIERNRSCMRGATAY
jgi:hypothetical protein